MNRKTLHQIIGLLFVGLQLTAQNVTIEVDGDDLYYTESGCSDCNSSADPRWNMRVFVNGSSYDWNFGDDDVTCGWYGVTNWNWTPVNSAPASASISMQINGSESDGFVSGGDDNVCGSYATVRTISINSSYPCQWNSFVDTRTCGSGTYGIYWSYWYQYVPTPGYDVTWTGAVSQDWNDYRNWEGCNVPGINQTVYIPNKSNDPIIYSGNTANCKNITIDTDAGATLQIQDATTFNIAD